METVKYVIFPQGHPLSVSEIAHPSGVAPCDVPVFSMEDCRNLRCDYNGPVYRAVDPEKAIADAVHQHGVRDARDVMIATLEPLEANEASQRVVELTRAINEAVRSATNGLVFFPADAPSARAVAGAFPVDAMLRVADRLDQNLVQDMIMRELSSLIYSKTGIRISLLIEKSMGKMISAAEEEACSFCGDPAQEAAASRIVEKLRATAMREKNTKP